MKKVMLSEETKLLTNLFIPDVEAVFFRSNKDLIKKIKFLLRNPTLRKSIAKNGYNKVYKDKHSVIDRMKEFKNIVNGQFE